MHRLVHLPLHLPVPLFVHCPRSAGLGRYQLPKLVTTTVFLRCCLWVDCTLLQYKEAVQLVQAAIQLAPTNAKYRHSLGVVHEAAEQWSSAADAFERAVEKRPNDVKVAETWHLLLTLQAVSKHKTCTVPVSARQSLARPCHVSAFTWHTIKSALVPLSFRQRQELLVSSHAQLPWTMVVRVVGSLVVCVRSPGCTWPVRSSQLDSQVAQQTCTGPSCSCSPTTLQHTTSWALS